MRRAILVAYPERFVIDEARALADAAGYQVARVVTQRFLGRAKMGVGEGKAVELKELTHRLGTEALLFDERMRSVQLYNLAKLVGVEVVDREKLILEIFARRATTTEAKLQVKMAELRYEVPRAREKVRLAKRGEQPGFFGLGKYEVDVYYRAMKARLRVLSRKLAAVRQRRELYRQQRQRQNLPVVALAGYTAAGKTTLFNALVREAKEVGAGAFTTLSPAARSLELSGARTLLSDTVGFISRLPTYMIEAFRSTLEELTFAHLVLLVVDGAEPVDDVLRKYDSCVKILAELDVPPGRVHLVLNKADIADEANLQHLWRVLNAAPQTASIVSARTGAGLAELRVKIHNVIFQLAEEQVRVPQVALARLAPELDWVKQQAAVEIQDGADASATVRIKGPQWVIDRFRAACAVLTP